MKRAKQRRPRTGALAWWFGRWSRGPLSRSITEAEMQRALALAWEGPDPEFIIIPKEAWANLKALDSWVKGG